MFHWPAVRALGFVFLLPLTVSMAATACGGSSSDSLVVYSGRSESLVGPIIDQFRDATGIDVSVKYGKTPQIAATLLEEGDNSPADVFFAQDSGDLGVVVGMLSALPDDIVDLVPEWARPPCSRPAEPRAPG